MFVHRLSLSRHCKLYFITLVEIQLCNMKFLFTCAMLYDTIKIMEFFIFLVLFIVESN